MSPSNHAHSASSPLCLDHQQCAIARPHEQQFVSILARPFERALLGVLDCIAEFDLVSILARPFERALHPRLCRANARGMFSFNPRPPFRAGATCKHARRIRPHNVSILALPFGRALLGITNSGSAALLFQSSPSLSEGRYHGFHHVPGAERLFQSSPSLSEGRYLDRGRHEPHRLVSILALPFGRALLDAVEDRKLSAWFQSSPSLSEGRYSISSWTRRRWRRFNPRPPFRKGATESFPRMHDG